MMRTWCVLAGLAAVIGSSATGAEVLIVDEGQPKAVIVLAAAPSSAARQAAEMVRSHLREMSGATIEIRRENELGEAAGTQIHIGQSRLTEALGLGDAGLGPGGIRIKTMPGAVAVYGLDDKTPTDPLGTLHAATVLLERLGCRYLWPGRLGKIVPKRSTVVISDVDITYTPAIIQRRIRSLGYSDRLQQGLDRLGVGKEDYERRFREATDSGLADPGWFGWQCLGGSMNLRAGHAFGHYWEAYHQQHPEWFALQPNGSREHVGGPERARLCKTNPELIATIVREKIAELEADPSRLSVSLSPNDGGPSTFCMCDRCRQLDPAEGRKIELHYDDRSGGRTERKYFEYVSLTDRMCWFYNAVAEGVVRSYPDALLVADAYSVYSAPPVRSNLHPNIVVRFVPMTYLSDEGRRRALADWDAWAAAARQIYFRPNVLNGGRRDGTPLIFVHKLAEDLRYLAGHRMVGTDFDSCLHNWATHGLNYYVLARLLWDPEQDVDALVDDYCRSGFGPAADAVKRYLLRIEELTDSIARSTAGDDFKEVDVTAPYASEVVDELRGLLGDATRAAGGDEPVCARIEFLRQGLEFTGGQAALKRLLADRNPLDRAEAKKLLEEHHRRMREIFDEHHLAVNVAYVMWGSGAYWKRLGWQWPEPEK